MSKIEVKDAKGEVLHTYDIYADNHGSLITDEHMFFMAKLNAIEDELVSEDEADQLTFKVIK